MDDWDGSFRSLPLPSSAEDAFTVVPFLDRPAISLGKDREGRPAFLIAATQGASAAARLRLRHVEAAPNQACVVVRRDGTQLDQRLSIVRCLGGDDRLHSYFLRVVGGIVGRLATNPSGADIQAAITQVAELFHALTIEGARSVQGLWAELFVIATARDPATLVEAWHEDPLDIFDFALGSQRAEVKSVARLPRHHHFAFEQLDPPPTVSAIIVSLTAAMAAAGRTIAELVDEISGALSTSPGLVTKLNRIVALSLGSDWAEASTARFDHTSARRDLAFFFADAVPRLSAPLPRGVSDVRFVSDLSSCSHVPDQELIAAGGLFAALRPRK
ncbi:MAG: PD-(D/E)XK motif protein [Dehalococcoidia bacterium]|nr:PD-(D/E)XK motif protein [Dehalococcoidia bacterium]